MWPAWRSGSQVFLQMFAWPAFRVIPGMHNHRRLAEALIGSPSELARVSERIGVDPRKAVFRAGDIDRDRAFPAKPQAERLGAMRWLLGARTDPM
jgi:hypothetical protein